MLITIECYLAKCWFRKYSTYPQTLPCVFIRSLTGLKKPWKKVNKWHQIRQKITFHSIRKNRSSSKKINKPMLKTVWYLGCFLHVNCRTENNKTLWELHNTQLTALKLTEVNFTFLPDAHLWKQECLFVVCGHVLLETLKSKCEKLKITLKHFSKTDICFTNWWIRRWWGRLRSNTFKFSFQIDYANHSASERFQGRILRTVAVQFATVNATIERILINALPSQ